MKFNHQEITALLHKHGATVIDEEVVTAITDTLNAMANGPKRGSPKAASSKAAEYVDEHKYGKVREALMAGEVVKPYLWTARGYPRISGYVELLRSRGYQVLTIEGDHRGCWYVLDETTPFEAGTDFRPVAGTNGKRQAKNKCAQPLDA